MVQVITKRIGYREAPLRWYDIIGALHHTALLGSAVLNKHYTLSRTSS